MILYGQLAMDHISTTIHLADLCVDSTRELMLHLILHLVHNYETDYYIRWLLDNTRIHIMPSMNPDGFEVATEGTCQGGQGR